jgi:nitrogen regulatory protein PII
MTSKMITPEYVKRTKVVVVISDSAVKEVIDEISNNISPGKEAHGMIFVKDVNDAFELSTKRTGDAVLSTG